MISVCMASYNGDKFIREQITSILMQLSDDDELIISDDGSIDDTIKIIESFNDSRIKLLHHEKTKTPYNKKSLGFYYATENFENALKQAKGDYIFLADQDDIWLSQKVFCFMEAMKKADIVMSNFNTIDENGTLLQENVYKKSPMKKSIVGNVIKSKFLGCCMAFNRNVLNYVLPFPEGLLAHDWWIGTLGCKKFNFSYINTPLFLYRRSRYNVSSSTEKSNNSFFYKLKFRLDFFKLVIKRVK